MISAPNGSTWYAWGHHYEVIGQTSKDGLPAVWVKTVSNGRPSRKVKVPVLAHLLAKHGTRTDEG